VKYRQPKIERLGVDREGRTSLHYAAAESDAALCKTLLSSGLDPNTQDNRGWAPLHFAAQATSGEVIALLLGAGATPDIRDMHGNTLLSTAVFSSKGDGSVIALLRQAGADPAASNKHGVSPVSLARTIANYNVAQFFVDVS